LTFLRKDGSRFLGEASSVLAGDEGQAYVIVRDITERRTAEQELRKSEERYRLLIEANPMGVASGCVAGDRMGEILTANDAFLRLLGYSRGELQGGNLHWTGIASPEHLPLENRAIAEARSSGFSKPYEGEFIRRDGSRAPVMIAFAQIERTEDEAVVFAADLTDQKRAEERLRQAQKLESIGLLAGGIAHDFNNLLTGIMGNASLAIDEVPPASAELLNAIMSSAERAAHLTRQLLAYSGKGEFFVQEMNLSQAIKGLSGLVQLSIPKSVELRLDLRERLPLVAMDPGQLQQIVMNLAINAGEAIGEGSAGRISLSTDIRDIDQAFVDSLGEEVAAGRYVILEIADTGPGIEGPALAKIFDPFFTTKFTGRGLGLAAVSGIVRSQRGGIIVASVPGQGAAFRVFFRASQTGRTEQQPARTAHGTILVVDDEEAVRKFIATVLQKEGYRALEACDGREALAICEEEHELDAVILDLVMPVMGGGAFLSQIKAVKRDLKVLLTSGYTETEARRLCVNDKGDAFIQKPYTARQLAKAVEELLRSSG
jgi:PAS domain S-box-containing protein